MQLQHTAVWQFQKDDWKPARYFCLITSWTCLLRLYQLVVAESRGVYAFIQSRNQSPATCIAWLYVDFFFKEYECYNSLDPVYSCRCPPLQDCSCEVSREKCWLEIKRRVGRGERIKTMKDIDPIRGCQSDKKLGKGFKMRKKILRLGCKSPGKRRSNVVTACHVMKVPNQRHFSNYNGVGFLLQIHAH